MDKNTSRNPTPLKVALFEKGITQLELSKHLGCNVATINRKLNRSVPFSMPEGIIIAKLLNKTLDELFG